MGCCGKKREQFLAGVRTGPLSNAARTPFPHFQPARYERVFFEYLGNTGLTVVGPVTGKHYRFDRPGARVEVDLRDRRPLTTVPRLRQILYR